jgi:hypothetical protein
MYYAPIPVHHPDLIVGLDLGQANDSTGLVQLERSKDDRPRYDVQAIQRLELGMPYPAVVAHTYRVIEALADMGPRPSSLHLVVDYTGVGRPIADMLLEAGFHRLGCQLTLITITGGDSVTRGDRRNEYRVPKRDLASSIQVLLQDKRLRFAAGLPMVQELKKELTGFRVKIKLTTGHDSYGAGEDWRSAAHDDLVLALAMATWYGETVFAGGWTREEHAGFGAWLTEMGVGGIT